LGPALAAKSLRYPGQRHSCGVNVRSPPRVHRARAPL
jgi:hypothetical protein